MTWHRQKVKNLEYQRKEKVEFNPPRRRRNQRAKKQSGTSSKKSPEDPKRLLLIVDRDVVGRFAFCVRALTSDGHYLSILRHNAFAFANHFPAFFVVNSTVLGSMRFSAIVSYGAPQLAAIS